MPAAYELKYRDGRVEELWGHRGYYYVLGPETLLCFLPIPAWCSHCANIQLAEHLMKPEELEAELKQLHDPQSEWHRTRPRPPLQKDIAFRESFFRNQLTLWSKRTSQPRCMNCGEPRVSFFVEGKWSPHPHSGEEVLFSCVGMCSTDFAMRFYNPDGVELTLSEDQRKDYLSLVNAGKYLW